MNAPITLAKKSQRSVAQNTPREVRAAYCYFHEKRTKNAAGVPFTKKDGTLSPRFSVSLMFPKLHTDRHQDANYLWLWGIACEAAQKMWPQSVNGSGQWVMPEGAQYPVDDGDVPYVSKPKPGQPVVSAEERARKNAWRVGYWIVEANNFLDPGPQIGKVIGGVETALAARVVNGMAQYKSGDWGIANVHAFAYENETFGIGFGFDGFCFTREGDEIGGSGPKSVESMFGGVAAAVAGAPAPSAAHHTAPPMPPASAPPAAPMPPTPPRPAAPPMPPAPVAHASGLPPLPGR